jgi:hypothetical protein
MKNALVVSLKFNPGHFSHLAANYKLFRDSGFRPYLYVHPGFRMLDANGDFDTISPAITLEKPGSVDVVVFWFPSVRNIFEITRFRLFYKSRIIYIYHEPFDSIVNYHRSGFGIRKILKICMINLVNIPVILLSTRVVLPSAKAMELYRRKYTLLNRNYSMMPLLFDDEAGSSFSKEGKTYFSYIGTIAADHAFDRFVQFVDHAVVHNLLPELTFIVATRNEIPARERKILEQHMAEGRVVVHSGQPMTNEAINGFFRKSLVVWNAYHRSMQSGVLPKAYMFGAPVVALSGNVNEFFENHRTGIAISDNNNVAEIGRAVKEIMENKDFYIDNCRNKFLTTFYYKNSINDFMDLLSDSEYKMRNS